ncbi:hypothetical protein CALVIDRAFT_542727 [Calocera viscosa TUFC12733]|uniref:ORC1/DEAH AAA+ ATPase domain-containing protein n=1 Tax=Calocera viscosa (strain TUFC12733) TaxID=1330018 RepID=A0A167GC83_CALVF|nr:hypothetical protein CALVIDRAFT_542727 [Calocera viscosa TUFC12733]
MAAASSSSIRTPAGGTRTSVVKLPKIGFRSLKNSVDPLLGKLGDAAIKVLGLTNALTTNRVELESLAQRVEEVTEDILQQAQASPEAEGLLVADVGRVQSVIDGIVEFLHKQREREVACSTALVSNSDAIREDIAIHKARLNDVMVLLNTNLTMKLFSKIHFSSHSIAGDGVDKASDAPPSHTFPAEFPSVPLPPNPRIFHGRESFLQLIQSTLLRDEGARLAILGAGGIGKTSMASAVLHDPHIAVKFGRRRVFVSCEGFTSAKGLVAGLSAALKITSEEKEDLLLHLIDYLLKTACPVLLVLDNFETPWDGVDQDAVEELLRQFDDINNLSFIVTMRGTQRPGGVKWSRPVLTSLEPVDLATARTIYLENGGLDGDGLHNLLAPLDGLPLALVLLAYHGQNRSPAELARAYQAERTALLTRGRSTRLTSLHVSISLTLNSQTMKDEPDATETLRLLSLLPDGVNGAELSDVLPRLPNRSKAIRTLQDLALISRSESRLKVLAPVRECILATQGPAGPLLTDLRRYYYGIAARFVDWGKTLDGMALLRSMAEVHGNIHAVVMHALKHSDISNDLIRAIWGVCNFQRLRGEDCVPLIDAALVHGGEAPEFATMVSTLWFMKSTIHLQSNERDAAEAAIQRAKESNPQFGPQGECCPDLDMYYTYQMARLHEELGHLDASIQMWTEVREVNERDANKLWVAYCNLGIGRIYCKQGRFDESYELLHQARMDSAALEASLLALNCAVAMGDVQIFRGNFVEAIPDLLEVDTGARNLGLVVEVAASLRNLAICCCCLEMFENAAQAWEVANAEYEKIADSRVSTNAANYMRTLATGYCNMGLHREEHIVYLHAIDHCTRTGLDELGATLREDMSNCTLCPIPETTPAHGTGAMSL